MESQEKRKLCLRNCSALTRAAFLAFFFTTALLLGGCSADPPPKSQNNICLIFKTYPKWYREAHQAQMKWNVPISVQMAIIWEESHFRAKAAPKHEKLWHVLPWFRATTALGYAQATDASWEQYVHDQRKIGADRGRFSNAVDFIGWYAQRAEDLLSIQKTDVLHLYLAYHEGINGYRQGRYAQKPWLIAIAKKVARQASRYHSQLVRCHHQLPSLKRGWF